MPNIKNSAAACETNIRGSMKILGLTVVYSNIKSHTLIYKFTFIFLHGIFFNRGQEICVCSRCGEGSLLSFDIGIIIPLLHHCNYHVIFWIGFSFSFEKRDTDPVQSITIDENSDRATFCGVATGSFGNATIVVGAEVTPHTSTGIFLLLYSYWKWSKVYIVLTKVDLDL